MKRISNLFLCLMLAVGAAAYAQETMNKTVTGRVLSSSAFDLAIQTDAGTRLNLVMDSETSKPSILNVGDQVTVVYRAIDTGGFQAVQVLEGTQATDSAKPAGTTTRTLTNVGTPGTAGQTGDSRTTVVGTTGGYQAPARPTQPNDPSRSMDSMDKTGSTAGTATAPMNDTMDHSASMGSTDTTMDHSMDNDTTADDTMANNKTTAMADDNSLPQTAGREPAVFVFGLIALGAAAFLMRQRTAN